MGTPQSGGHGLLRDLRHGAVPQRRDGHAAAPPGHLHDGPADVRRRRGATGRCAADPSRDRPHDRGDPADADHAGSAGRAPERPARPASGRCRRRTADPGLSGGAPGLGFARRAGARPTARCSGPGKQDVRAAEAAHALARREIWPDLQLGVIYGQRPMPGRRHRSDGELHARLQSPDLRRASAAPDAAGDPGDAATWPARTCRPWKRTPVAGWVWPTPTCARRGSCGELYRATLLPQARATVTSSLAAYQVGEVNLMTLLDAQMTVNRYQQELYQLAAAEGRGWAELEMLAGRRTARSRPHPDQRDGATMKSAHGWTR